jgi:hypothetical protein
MPRHITQNALVLSFLVTCQSLACPAYATYTNSPGWAKNATINLYVVTGTNNSQFSVDAAPALKTTF